MNASGLLQSKWTLSYVKFARDPEYSLFHEQTKKDLLQLIFTFYHKYLNHKNYLKFMKQNSFVFNTISYIKRFYQSVIQEVEQPAWTQTANGAN